MNDISSAVTQLGASSAGRPLWASWETPAPTNWPHRESRSESSRSHLSQRMRVGTSEPMSEAARKYWLRGSTINPLQISCKISSVLVELQAFILIHLWLIGFWCSLLKHCNDQRFWGSLTAGYICVLRNERNSVSFCYLALWWSRAYAFSKGSLQGCVPFALREWDGAYGFFFMEIRNFCQK